MKRIEQTHPNCYENFYNLRTLKQLPFVTEDISFLIDLNLLEISKKTFDKKMLLDYIEQIWFEINDAEHLVNKIEDFLK